MASHHGENSDSELRKLFEQQREGVRQRAWPNGRLSASDDGETAIMIAADAAKGAVVMCFPKPMEWIAMKPEQAVLIAQNLIKQARAIKPVTVVIH